jgi:polysaccharide export outer membrane protein
MACLGFCLARGSLQAATPPPGDLVQTLGVQSSNDGATVTLMTTVPVPQFTCLLDKSDPHQVVIDFPAAASRLKKRYALGSPLVREALVEKSPGPGVALRIRLTLGEGVLAGVELTGQGVNLRFRPGAPAPIQGAGPAPLAARPPAPNEEAATLADYLIGTGDKLEIAVIGHEDLDRVLEVRGDGTIGFPLIGDVPVAGKGLSQIGREMTQSLGKDYIINPQVSVNIKEYGSQWVTVIGEVNKPGRQLLKQKTRLLDLLAEAGGFTAYANRKQIEILRPEGADLRRKMVVNLRAIEEGKSTDVPLTAGDVVIIPRRTF